MKNSNDQLETIDVSQLDGVTGGGFGLWDKVKRTVHDGTEWAKREVRKGVDFVRQHPEYLIQ